MIEPPFKKPQVIRKPIPYRFVLRHPPVEKRILGAERYMNSAAFRPSIFLDRMVKTEKNGDIPFEELSLKNKLIFSLEQIKGSPDHTTLLRYLKAAQSYRLSPTAAATLQHIQAAQTVSVEQNVDFAVPDVSPLWLEWDEVERFGSLTTALAGKKHAPQEVGALIIINAQNMDQFTIFVAWSDKNGRARHSYVGMMASLDHMSSTAFFARKSSRKNLSVSRGNLLDAVHVYMPPELQHEVRYLNHIAEKAEEVTNFADLAQDATAELSFILSILIALQTKSVALLEQEESGHYLVEALPERQSFISKWLGKDPNRFVRRMQRRTPYVTIG